MTYGTVGSGAMGVPGYLRGRIEHAEGFAYAGPPASAARPDTSAFEQVEDVADLRAKLTSYAPAGHPTLVTVRGVFYPALLLFAAWWERRGDPAWSSPWRTDLQRWLFHGFEHWGPSWDVNGPLSDDLLLGQLGREDELESMLVVLTGAPAAAIRRETSPARPVVELELTGALNHRRQLPGGAAGQGTDGAFDFGLLVSDEDPRHVARVIGEAELYSAYLWHCWAPVEWIGDATDPQLHESFFAWEHTDLANAEARAYALAGLEQKRAYLEEMHGELRLLQKSSPVVGGDPVFPTRDFRAFLERRA